MGDLMSGLAIAVLVLLLCGTGGGFYLGGPGWAGTIFCVVLVVLVMMWIGGRI